MEPLISAKDLKKNFGKVEALKGVSLDVAEGEKVVVIGPSGSGKSVLIRSINGLERPDSGELTVNGIDMMAKKVNTRKLASEVAMVFQGYNLYPHKTVLENVTFAPTKVLKVPKAEAEEAGRAYLERVGLTSKLDKYPDQLSGGQRQRVAIARALILEPKLIICDEPVSALDVSIQAQVVNLLQQLQREMGLSLIFIAHDLAVVKHISDRVLVMYLGHAVELGTYDEVYHNPLHPYTKALMSAVPIPDPDQERNKVIQLLEGELPSPINPPSGCVFRTRCPIAGPECAKTRPVLEGSFRHAVSCLKVDPL